MPVYVDIETLDFFSDPAIKALPRAKQIEAIRFGLAVTIDDRGIAEQGYERTERWPDADICPRLWDFLLQADVVVGWNILAFDLPIIKRVASEQGYPDPGLTHPNTCDLFDRIRAHTGRWYKLGDCAVANGVGEKSADGQQAAEWLRSGNWEAAAKYCEQDVRLTQRLFDLARADGLVLPPRPTAKFPETQTFRIWIDGERWKLLNEDNGEMYDEVW